MAHKEYESLFNKFNQKKYIYESLLLIENGAGNTIFSKAYGEKSIDSPIAAASITKMFTATCIFVLVQNGLVSLNDKLLKYYTPYFLNGLHTYKGKDYSCELRISDLLFQTSGLADIYEEGSDSIKKQAILSDIYFSFTDKIALTKKRMAHFAPDTGLKAHYTDINYDILGDIIEKVTQSPLEQVFQNYIFAPLCMTRTYLPISEKEHIPTIYYKAKPLYRPKFIICSRASGGCITTIRELMIFTKAFFNGKLFDKKLLNELTEYRKLQATMTPIQYGSGYMRIKMKSLSTSFMGQGSLIGHSGSTGAFAFFYPHRDLFFVGDFNQMKYPSLPVRFVMQLAMFTP